MIRPTPTSSSSGRLTGTVVAVTGGARGIGAATATALARDGARVALGDLDLDVAAATAERIGGDTLAVRLDVTDPKSFASFLDEVEERLGAVDVVVNNAGIMPLGTLLEEDDAVTARILDVNVLALITASREAARRMVARGSGQLVNVASTAGKAGVPGGATYCASKSAVLGFSEAIRQELAPHGVAVTVVLPGIVRTELAAGLADLPGFRSVTPETVGDAIAEAVASRRPEVYVPRSAKALLRSTDLLPHRARMWMARRMRVDSVFMDARRHPERTAYEARAVAPRQGESGAPGSVG
jgi:short-subunit dehydrogenase